MDEQKGRLIRIAGHVHTSLLNYHWRRKTEAIASLRDIFESLDELKNIQRRFTWVEQRNMPAAMTSQVNEAGRHLRYVLNYAAEGERRLNECNQEPPKLADILAELTQAEDEFEQAVKFDRAAGTLSVTTDHIDLEDIALGRFEIKIRLNDLGCTSARHPAYSVIAKDPNPAGGNDQVTHPHVSHDTLCEGDASVALHKSLLGGRLSDFFTLVRSVLQTYNPDSPYVRLDEWNGVSCHDCGATVDSDNLSFCEYCENDFCESCIGYCHVCDTTRCFNCLTTCHSCERKFCGNSDCGGSCDECGEPTCDSCLTRCKCGNRVCDSCLKACKDCERKLCTSCVTDDLCKECVEKKEIKPVEEPNNVQKIPPPTAAVHRRRRRTTGTTVRRRRRTAPSARTQTARTATAAAE
jgi:hypothetical protein